MAGTMALVAAVAVSAVAIPRTHTAAPDTDVAAAQTSDGCSPDVGPITESQSFTPYDARLSHLPDSAIASLGHADSSDERIDGLPLRWSAGDGPRASYRYFQRDEIDRGETVADFMAAGGIQLDRDAVADGDPYTADDVIAQVGERAVNVQIGDYDGALVWADPESNGARPHNVYWSDGTYNYTLRAVRGPQRMVQLAREYVCGG
jgi:hypothetical protein